MSVKRLQWCHVSNALKYKLLAAKICLTNRNPHKIRHIGWLLCKTIREHVKRSCHGISTKCCTINTAMSITLHLSADSSTSDDAIQHIVDKTMQPINRYGHKLAIITVTFILQNVLPNRARCQERQLCETEDETQNCLSSERKKYKNQKQNCWEEHMGKYWKRSCRYNRNALVKLESSKLL